MNRSILALAAAFCVLTVTAAEPPAVSGFTVKPPPGWTELKEGRKADRAVWGMSDPQDPRHTTIAIVRISRVSPVKLTVKDLKQAAEKQMEDIKNSRIRDFHHDMREGTRLGVPSLELRTMCVDTGVTPAARMVSHSFLLVTPGNRMLSAIVSERSADPQFRFNAQEASKFLDAVSW